MCETSDSNRFLPDTKPRTAEEWLDDFVTILKRAGMGGNDEARLRIAARWLRGAQGLLAGGPPREAP